MAAADSPAGGGVQSGARRGGEYAGAGAGLCQRERVYCDVQKEAGGVAAAVYSGGDGDVVIFRLSIFIINTETVFNR